MKRFQFISRALVCAVVSLGFGGIPATCLAQSTLQPANQATETAQVPPDGSKETHDPEHDRRTQAVAWIQNSAEYRALCRQTYRLASLQMQIALNDIHWSADEVQLQAADFQQKPPAVILDVDETVLDNSAFNARNIVDGEEYSLTTWNQWCLEEKAGAIEGAREFLSLATALGVKVFFVTNRRDAVKEATIHNLNSLELGVVADQNNVITRSDEDGRGGDKISRRASVAKDFRVLLLIGDNLSDLCDGMEQKDQTVRNETADRKTTWMGTRWIVMPNPVYGSWERCLPKGSEMLQLKRD